MATPSNRIAPGPPGNFLLGNLREFRRDVLGLVTRSAAQYGDIARCRLGPHVVHLLNHPDHVEHVLQRRAANYDKRSRSTGMIRSITGESLLTGNGEFWRRQRRMAQPAFHHRQVAGFTGKMTGVTEMVLREWRERAAAGGVLDIASEMSRLTYAIVARTLFSIDSVGHADRIERAMRVMLPHVFNRLGEIPRLPDWFPSPANRRFRQALAEVDHVVYQIIAGHREAEERGEPCEDLLGMLMSARDPDTGGGLSDAQLRNETVTFLLAGHETTANALSWTFHLIASHPGVERQLMEEIRLVLGGRTPVLEDVAKLPLTKRVIQEAMRLYPPIWIIERRAVAADEIAGYRIPAGSSVVISPYALHRHPAFWKNPEDFDPSRFESTPPDAYIPFGSGARFCIGHEFAMLEARLILAMVLQAFRLRGVPGHPVEPMPDITLRPRHGLKMTLHPIQCGRWGMGVESAIP
jgi:cytochrome P450